jgi:type I restriction enzyme S subunit
MKHINRGPFLSHIIALPPLAEQERIVAKVDELMRLCDDLAANQEHRLRTTIRFRASALDALTEAATPDQLRLAWQRVETNWPAVAATAGSIRELRETILQLAFEGRLAGAGVHGRSRPGRGQAILDGPFPIPGHWRWARFDEVADGRLGKMLDKAKNTGPLRPYLRNANVQWFRFDLSDVHKLRLEDADLETHSVRPGDLVICEGGEPGRLAVCDDAVDAMVFQKALHRVRPRGDVDVWYLAYLLRCYAGSGYLSTFFTGATIKHLTGRSLGRVPVPLPPLAEQHQVVSCIRQLIAECDRLDTAIGELAARKADLAFGLAQIV